MAPKLLAEALATLAEFAAELPGITEYATEQPRVTVIDAIGTDVPAWYKSMQDRMEFDADDFAYLP